MTVRIEWDQSGLDHIQGLSFDALKALAEDIVTDAQDLAPVASGKLRDSIHVEPDEANHTVSVVADVDYAADVEAGTSTHKAQPYLRPAGFKARSL